MRFPIRDVYKRQHAVRVRAEELTQKNEVQSKSLPKKNQIEDYLTKMCIRDSFNDGGCQDFFLILNYKKGMVKAYFDDLERDYEVSYIEEEEFLGTGGGLKLVEGQIDDTFFFTNCDVLVDADLQSIYEEHKKTGNAITIVCSLKHYTIPYGTIEIAEGGEIKKMTEKPTISSLVNTGCYLVEPSVLSLIGENEVIGFPDVAPVSYTHLDVYKRQPHNFA